MAPLVISEELNFIPEKSRELIKNEFKLKIVWKNVFIISSLHIGAVYGAYLMISSAKYQTVIAWYLFSLFSGMGITAGAHRLWSHRSYKAKFPLRLLLCFLNTMAIQNDLYDWCRDHRVHHKFSETDADPHNASRGFFFSHMGWLLCKKHPDVMTKGKLVDLTDLLNDPIIRFQRKYYPILVVLIAISMPTLIPYLCWSETIFNSFFICVIFRYCYILNSTWLVNSAAHMWGQKPYDLTINPRDYSASELDWKYNWNFSTMFIDLFARIGWAYDRKKVSTDMISSRIKRTGYKPMDSISETRDLWIHRVVSLFIALSHIWIPFLLRFFIISNHI